MSSFIPGSALDFPSRTWHQTLSDLCCMKNNLIVIVRKQRLSNEKETVVRCEIDPGDIPNADAASRR